MLRTGMVLWVLLWAGAVLAQPATKEANPSPATGATNKRFALVIGNSAYRHTVVLANPAHDAREMAAALRRIDVNVQVLLDADRATMIKALEKLSRATEHADLAIVHYSGHGIEINGNNYLLPTSAELNQPSDAERQAITFDQVYAAISKARGMKLILLDACRDNPIAGRLGLPPRRGLSAPSPPSNILVAFATRHGEVAEDGLPGGTSPFTGAVLKNISKAIDIRTMFQNVRDDVLAATKFRQSPFTYGHLPSADYILAPRK
jgi:uncharacterized caspase-like protein